jgi:hypothetical protein
VRVSLAGVGLAVLAFAAFAGMSSYVVLRHMEMRSGTEAEAVREFDEIKKRFAGRQPLVEMTGPQARDIRINRLVHPQGLRAKTLYVVTWSADDDRVLRTDVPLWLMRFSTLNILSSLGVAPDQFRLTVVEIERYGPGLVVDYRRPAQTHVLIWVE